MGNHALHQKHPESVADDAKYCHSTAKKATPQNSDAGEGAAGGGVAGSSAEAGAGGTIMWV